MSKTLDAKFLPILNALLGALEEKAIFLYKKGDPDLVGPLGNINYLIDYLKEDPLGKLMTISSLDLGFLLGPLTETLKVPDVDPNEKIIMKELIEIINSRLKELYFKNLMTLN